ncbi:hypothetical protein Rsub_00982 [Raphidocelis subcapitata]|uniref:Uncharacterized protein n=1 Tax=Raphidocelis subcapitata TaxID=307507 RepID=A0A2V0NRS6_9CHLO|nr:hypothetical protein Rsub_00982 [Raphidocelis subcapitata]|eukprot:GBF88270.1 hypothetical protein Rsub_00982 [Raphidocelis subcapitata]
MSIPLLLLALAVAAGAPRAALAACSAPCSDPRTLPGGWISQDYCLVKFSKDCTFKDKNGALNSKCLACSLWVDAQAFCPVAPGCLKGLPTFQDGDKNDCGPLKNNWFGVLSKRAVLGIEELLDGGGSTFDKYFETLYESSLPGQSNACSLAHPLVYQANKLTFSTFAIVQNTVAYRSKHQMHIHIGPAQAQLKTCVDAILKRTTPAAKTFTPKQSCTFTTRTGSVSFSAWVWLDPAPSPGTKGPDDVGTVVTRAYKNNGPVSDPALHGMQFTGVAVTGVTYQNKQYWAVMIYNYYSAWANNKQHQIGDHEMIQG